MALKRRTTETEKSSSSSFTNLVDGEQYEGRLVYVADLGLQEREYKGDVKPPCQQLSLGIEILGETVEIDGDKLPRLMWTNPFNIFSSLTDKGKELEFYKVFEPSATVESFADWEGQLGKPCSVTVKHTKKDDAVYDNIGALTTIPKKYQSAVPEGTIDTAIGDADDENNPATKALFGLAKWKYDQRIDESGNSFDEDDMPF